MRYRRPRYLKQNGGEIPNRLIVLEEMLNLWLANANPAFEPFSELFDEKELRLHFSLFPDD